MKIVVEIAKPFDCPKPIGLREMKYNEPFMTGRNQSEVQQGRAGLNEIFN